MKEGTAAVTANTAPCASHGEPDRRTRHTSIAPSAPSGGRLGWVDIARALAMLAVIFGHVGTETMGAGYTQDGAYGLITMVINPVKLPLFFALSGYLFSAKNDDLAYLARRTVRARLVPYAVWGSFMGLVASAMDLLRCGFDFGRLPSLLLSDYVLPFLRGNLIWFIPCLTVLELIFVLLLRLSKKRTLPLVLLTALCTVLGYLVSSRGEILPWKIDTALTSTQFMTLGYLLRRLYDGMRCDSNFHNVEKSETEEHVDSASETNGTDGSNAAERAECEEKTDRDCASNAEGAARADGKNRISAALTGLARRVLGLGASVRTAIFVGLYAVLLASFNTVWRGCPVNMNLGGYFNPALFTVLSFVGVLAVFALSELIGSSRVLCFIGRNTFVFCVWHMYAAKAGLALLGLLPHSGALPMTVAVLLVTVFSAAAAAVVSAAVNRFIPFSVGRPRR